MSLFARLIEIKKWFTLNFMDILLYNTSWMTFNLFLAVLPVLFSFFLFRKTHKLIQFVAFLLWFLFLPNTVYVITDLIHLIRQWGYFDSIGKIVLFLQYTIFLAIGLICFLIAFAPWERIFKKYISSNILVLFCLIAINFVIGFAMVLGRTERLNSWDIFVAPLSVIESSVRILTSYDQVMLIILLSLFSNFFYFFFREKANKLYLTLVKIR